MHPSFPVKPLISHAVKVRRHLAHLIPDVTGMAIAPISQHLLGIPADRLIERLARAINMITCLLANLADRALSDFDYNGPIGPGLAPEWRPEPVGYAGQSW